jgi:hypothetical protein
MKSRVKATDFWVALDCAAVLGAPPPLQHAAILAHKGCWQFVLHVVYVWLLERRRCDVTVQNPPLGLAGNISSAHVRAVNAKFVLVDDRFLCFRSRVGTTCQPTHLTLASREQAS